MNKWILACINCFFFFLIFINIVYANGLWIQTPHVEIDNINEIDEILGKDLYVDMWFEVYIPKEAIQLSDNTTIKFIPSYHVKHDNPHSLNISICKSADGIGTGYVYGSVSISCKEYLTNFIVEEIFEKYYKHPEYFIYIPTNKSEIYVLFFVHIMYVIPDFLLREGNNYVATFHSTCTPTDKCKIDSWERIITLPSATSVLEDISGDVSIYSRYKDRWVLRMSGGETSFIRFYDSVEKELYRPFTFALIGAILGFFLSCLKKFICGMIVKKKKRRTRKTFIF